MNFWLLPFPVLFCEQAFLPRCQLRIYNLRSRVWKKWVASQWHARETALDTRGTSSGEAHVESRIFYRFPQLAWFSFSSACCLLIRSLPHFFFTLPYFYDIWDYVLKNANCRLNIKKRKFEEKIVLNEVDKMFSFMENCSWYFICCPLWKESRNMC